MTLPAIILGSLIGLLLGGLLHLVVGGHFGRIVLYLIFGFFGFWIGQLVAMILGIELVSVGPLQLGIAIPVGIGLCAFGYWLSLVQVTKKPSQ